MPLVLRFAFQTAGCHKNEGARNCRAVARSFLGSVRMTCGAWPPCHKVRSMAHARGDFTHDASGARAGGSAFKKGSISREVVMPRSSCDHRAYSPSGPLDGVRWCSLEGSASRSSLPATYRRRAHARGGVTDLVFYLLLLEGCNPMEVGILPPSFGFKDFHHTARLQPPVGGHPQG